MSELDRTPAVCPDCNEQEVVIESSPDPSKPTRLRCKACDWVDVDDPRLQV